MRCSSLTRRHCCCRVASAIRSCSFRTRAWLARQSMACQPAGRAGYRGHTVVCIHLADILLKVLQYLMQLKTRRKSARFRVEACTAPYPDDYHQAFAFSVLLCPHRQQCSSRFTCHQAAIRVYQVPLNIQKVRAGSVYSPEISMSMCSGGGPWSNPISYLLVQAFQHLWPVADNGVYQQFTCVNPSDQPCNPAA